MNTENQMTDLMETLKAEWPNETKYRISLEWTKDGPEWFIRLYDELGDDICGWASDLDEALGKLRKADGSRIPLLTRKAAKVAELEAEIAKLQGEVTKAQAV